MKKYNQIISNYDNTLYSGKLDLVLLFLIGLQVTFNFYV